MIKTGTKVHIYDTETIYTVVEVFKGKSIKKDFVKIVSETGKISTVPIERIIDSNTYKVLNILNNDYRYTSRTLKGISKETEIPSKKVKAILSRYIYDVYCIARPGKNHVYLSTKRLLEIENNQMVRRLLYPMN